MRFSFLTLADLAPAIKADHLDQLTAGNNTLIAVLEEEAVSLASSYLNARFDVAAIFRSVTNYVEATAYIAGAQVWHNEEFYVALVDTSQATTTADWVVADRRDRQMIAIVRTITLYKLHHRIAGGKIPQPRTDDYLDAMDWLKAVAGLGKGAQITPELPVRSDPSKDVDTIRWASNPPQTHLW